MMNSRAQPCSHVYPSGWIHTLASKPTKPEVLGHHEKIHDLWVKVSKRTTERIHPDDVLEITFLAKELINDDTLGYNLVSSHLTDSVQEFLIDSLNFAVTGHRTVSIHSMFRILERHDVGDVLNSPSRKVDTARLKDKVEEINCTGELLRQWANQKNGIFDILCTLKLLF